jgi:hypothetical protein
LCHVTALIPPLLQDDAVVEKGKSTLKKAALQKQGSKDGKDIIVDDKDKEKEKDKSKKDDEEEKNDYSVKKTTKGGEFYDNFMNQVPLPFIYSLLFYLSIFHPYLTIYLIFRLTST